jgi:hypothetical protein
VADAPDRGLRQARHPREFEHAEFQRALLEAAQHVEAARASAVTKSRSFCGSAGLLAATALRRID